MAQLISVKLSRFDASPWGFRLQGGKDFGQPLVIQKVNGNSPAEKAGLQAGDALIKVNNVELFNLNHKDAQNAIVRAGNNFELTVQRGSSTWKPSVTPVGPAPTIQSGGNIQPVTKTSLAYKGPPAPQINAYNLAPRPFGGSQVNGETIKSITSKQYNTPVALYSEETIAETLSAQAEVLAGGVLGVNFKKNEKTYNAANSEVLKMVQEADQEPRIHEPADIATPQIAAPTTPKVANVPVSNPLSGLRHVSAPEPKLSQPAQDPLKVLPPGQNICADCERLIVGLFVRIKDKNLHVECFKCATCGTSLKNVGYYNINNKLYCDVHAKMVARQNPPAPNLEPVTIPPGGKVPSAVIASSIAAAPAPFQSQFSSPSAVAPGSPQPGTLAPLPFHTPASNIQAPKVNLNQPVVPSPLTRPQSDVIQEGNIQYQSYSTLTQSSFESKSENVRFEQSSDIKSESKIESSSSFSTEKREVVPQIQKKMSICSQEIGKMHMDAQSMVKHLNEILEDQDYQDRCPSPTPIDEAKKLAAFESKKTQRQLKEEETVQRIEQEQQWVNYQAEAGKEIVNQHLSKVKETGVAFLRSHSTPVSELESLYEQQQREIESQKQRIISLGTAKDQEVDDEKKKQIEEQIIASQKQIIDSQEKQKEIERKKHVRFQEEAEVKRRESLQVQQIEFEEQRRIREAQQIEQEQRRRYEEAQRRNIEEKQLSSDQARLLSLESIRDRARTPVAALEAYERDDEMSPKTEKIFHTYEQLIQPEDEIQTELVAKPETPKNVPIRPLTPARISSPFLGSIPLAEKSLLLKNIQGIEFEFEQANPKKPEPKLFKLPDLRNLGKTKPLTFTQAPNTVDAAPKPKEPELTFDVKKTETDLKEQVEFQQRQLLVQQQLKEVEEDRKQFELDEQKLLSQNPYLEQTVVDQKKILIQQEKIQFQQIKEQRKQVHEELAQNERFKRKQETLGPPKPVKYERSKTPVAEFEELDRQKEQSERTKQIYSSYDQVIQAEELPGSRVGPPISEVQTISEAEKALFLQNIQGDRQLKQQKSYEEYKDEQERLFQQQKIEQQKYFEQQRQLQQQNTKAVPTNMVSALTIAPDRPYSPLPSAPATIPQKVPLPEQTAPYIPLEQTGETKSLIDALTIAPEKPFAPQIFDAGSIDNAILNTERKAEIQLEQRRQSLGFSGVNVQRTPYQMLKGEKIKTAFQEDLKSQETAINQFLSKKPEETFKTTSLFEDSITQQFQSYSQESSNIMQASIAPGFGLVPASPQISYAPAVSVETRAELSSSQSNFGNEIQRKQEKPKQETKPLTRPMTMIEALTTAPEGSYSPFPEVPKPHATLICGGAAVALTKGGTMQREVQGQMTQSHVELKPIYQVKDVQCSKDKIGATGFSEEKREKQQEAGIIKGEGITGSYQKHEEKFESVQQTCSEKKGQKIEIPPLPLPPIIEQDTPKEITEIKSFPPVSDQLKSEIKQSIQSVQQGSQSIQQKASITQQSASFSRSSIQQSSSQQVSQKVSRSEDSTKVVERRVTEVIEHESSRKEFSQLKITGDIDPRSGLRRTSSENFLKKSQSSQLASQSGLQKPSSIPLYQSLLRDQPAVETVPVRAIESKSFQTRPRSVGSLQLSKSTDRLAEKAEDTKVPLAYRSRTPVPLAAVTFHGEPVKNVDQIPKNRLLPTYNQTEVYRSASPRPIPVPKQQLGTYFGQTVAKQTLQPGTQLSFRSTSPLPVPKMLGSTERYQQPITRRTVQPKEQPQPRVSWPPSQASSEPAPTSQYIPKKIGEQPVVPQQPSRPKSAGKKVSWPPQEATVEILRQEDLPENLHKQNIVKEQISFQEQQVLKNTKTSLIETQKKATQSLISKSDSQSKGPAPKSDPITAPRPFGTPTPQRKIATPHFQPIKPVAITQGQPTNITAPKLTFSSTKSSSIISETNIERKTSLTNSSDSAFKPIDVSPIKPTPFKPLSTFINANIDTAVLPSMNGLAKSNVPPSIVQKPIQNIQSSVQNIQKSIPKPDPIGKEPPNKQGTEVDKSGNSGGGAGGAKGATFAGATTPRRGKGVLNPPNAMRIPLCASCNGQIRGPFITALGKIWCPEHFICSNAQCRRPLADIGFVEEEGQGLFCEFCFEKYIAPNCDKCTKKIKGDCLNAIGKHFHPECFNCAYCGKLFGNSPFFLEDGLPYCEADWNELFTTKCFACGFPIEAGDRWVEALNNNYHSQCFNCTACKTNLEGQSFFAKGGRPFCKAHAR